MVDSTDEISCPQVPSLNPHTPKHSTSSHPRVPRIRAAVWCNLDPCGLICAGITYFLVAYSQYAVTVCVLGQWLGLGSLFGALHAVAFNVLACLAYASHARAMLTDPGAVSCHALVRMETDLVLSERSAIWWSSFGTQNGRGEAVPGGLCFVGAMTLVSAMGRLVRTSPVFWRTQ